MLKTPGNARHLARKLFGFFTKETYQCLPMEKHLPLHYDLALRDPFNKDQGPFWNSIVIIDFLGSGTPAGIQHQLLSLGVSWMPFVWRVELRNYPGCLKPWIPEVLAFTKDPFWNSTLCRFLLLEACSVICLKTSPLLHNKQLLLQDQPYELASKAS